MKLNAEGRGRSIELERMDHEDLAWKAACLESALLAVRDRLDAWRDTAEFTLHHCDPAEEEPYRNTVANYGNLIRTINEAIS